MGKELKKNELVFFILLMKNFVSNETVVPRGYNELDPITT